MSKTFPYAYIRKKIVPVSQATVPIQCKAIQYGLGCFTGIRGHWNARHKNLYLFRLRDHFERLSESAKILGMKFDYNYPAFKKIIFDLLKKNKVKEDVYIRPTLYAAATTLTPRFDNPDDDLAIYMISLKDYFHTVGGLNVCVSSWRRIDDDVLSTKAKSTGLYASSALAKTEAVSNGFDEAIFLDRAGHVCEASGANIFGVKEGEVWTPQLSSNILNGITRRCILEILEKEMGIRVREENFDRSMLYTFDELFFSGTAAKITNISAVDKRKIGNGKIGPITGKLKTIYEKAAAGELPNYMKWLEKVY